jgi:hypothetical protein
MRAWASTNQADCRHCRRTPELPNQCRRWSGGQSGDLTGSSRSIGLSDHPHRPLTQLLRIHTGPCHLSILPKPGSLYKIRGDSSEPVPDFRVGRASVRGVSIARADRPDL